MTAADTGWNGHGATTGSQSTVPPAAPTTPKRESKRDREARERNLNRVQARQNAEAARAAFAETLNQLEDKLNVPQQVAIKTGKLRAKARAFADEHPGATVAIGVAAAAVAGLGIWLIVRNATKD